jgi:hypothetical protein
MTNQKQSRHETIVVGSRFFVIRHCLFIRHSDFVIRHCPGAPAPAKVLA